MSRQYQGKAHCYDGVLDVDWEISPLEDAHFLIDAADQRLSDHDQARHLAAHCLAEIDPDFAAAYVVAHEVAHLITIACHGRTPPHGAEWRAVMRHLGISDPQRCHRYAVEESGLRRQRRWAYVCDCREHQLSTTRHNRIWRDQAEYLCRCCGSRLRPAAGESVPSV